MDDVSERLSATLDKEEMLYNSLALIVQLYTDKSHFLYELLQNAEDAGAHHVKFVQYDDRLELFHDGKPFSFSNLKALRDVCKSDKVKDLNKIGEFGVGFKSVFSICKNVELYSEPSNYREEAPESESEFAISIEDFYRIRKISKRTLESPYTTKFVFPYAVGLDFTGYTTERELKQKVAEKLQDLGITTLLFMKNLRSIEYKIKIGEYNKVGRYSLVSKRFNDHCVLISPRSERVDQTEQTSKKTEPSYLKFSRALDAYSHRTVDIAFAVIPNEKNEFECIRLEQSKVSVYFPTLMDSNLGFIVQGPYRTTPNRESIPNDNDDNANIASQTATLLKEALIELKKRGWLNLSFIRTLPLVKLSNNENKIYDVLYNQVLELFRNPALELLPCHNGGYVSARFAKLPRNEKMLELFDDETLTKLLREGTSNCRWLPSCITETSEKYKSLYSYLRSQLDVKLIRPDDLRNYIEKNSGFLHGRTNDWLVGFYELLSSIRGEFDKRKADSNYLTSAIIKILDGTFAAAYTRNSNQQLVPNVYLPTGEIQPHGLNFVHKEIYKLCKDFFESVAQIPSPDDLALFINDVKYRYSGEYIFKEHSHVEDVNNLLAFIERDKGNHELSGVIERDFLLLCTDGKMRNAHRENVYLCRTERLLIEDFFCNIADDVYFVDSNFYGSHQISDDQLCRLGVRCSFMINEDVISGDWEQGTRGRKPQWKTKDSFRRELSILHLEKALKYIKTHPLASDSILKSKTIFSILMENRNRLEGTLYIGVENREETAECSMLKSIKRFVGNWLYTKNRTWAAPKQIVASELSSEIYGMLTKHTEFYRSLGFKMSETEEVQRLKESTHPKVLAAYFESEIRRMYQMSPAELSERLRVHNNPPAVQLRCNFPSIPVKNWDMLMRHAREALYFAEPTRYEKVCRSVRVTKPIEEILAYLRGMYQIEGRDEYVCQMCKGSYTNTVKTQMFNDITEELIPLHLLLCPNCAAKYRNHRNNQNNIKIFRYKILSLNKELFTRDNHISINIGTDELCFTQIHIAEIQTLLRMRKR